jgi:fatty-acyl-CoA synthase
MVAVLKPDFHNKITGTDLRQFLLGQAQAGKIPRYGVPDRIEIVQAIPKTSVGKISKVELRRSYS